MWNEWKELMEGNQIRFIESSDSGIKKLVASAVPERTKKSPKYAVNVFEGEDSYEQTFKI